MVSNLKPCPFCGGDGCISIRNLYSVQVYQAKYTSCTAGIDQMFNTESDAIDAWNKRVDDTQKDLYDQELYGYNLHDLLVFAIACRRASVDCNDLKTFSNNCEFAYAAIQNEWERSVNQAINQMFNEQSRIE